MSAFLFIVAIVHLIFMPSHPQAASWSFLVVFGVLLHAHIYVTQAGRKTTNYESLANSYGLDEFEVEALYRYHFYARYPFASMSLSRIESGLGLLALPLAGYLIYRGVLVQALLIFALVPLTWKTTRLLNPLFYLERDKKTDIHEDMMAFTMRRSLTSAMQKLYVEGRELKKQQRQPLDTAS